MDQGLTATVDPQGRTLLTGAVVLRWAALVWGTLALVVQHGDGDVARPALGAAVLGVAATWTVAVTVWTARRPQVLAAPVVAVVDLAVALGIVAADPFVLRGTPVQSFGSAWPLAAVVTAGVLRGPAVGAVAGAAVGVVGTLAAVLGDRPGWLGPAGTTVLLATGGAVAGHVTRLLRRAESEVARARAREEVARTLHDGVLQTLAVVQRRSGDPDLSRLARSQELDLRRFLAGDGAPGSGAGSAGGARERLVAGLGRVDVADVADGLRQVLRVVEDRHGLRCQLVVVEAPPPVPPAVAEAVRGAVGEALTNVAKHSGADAATVCLDATPGGGIAVTVKDGGAGLPDGGLVEGTGWRTSIRGRMEEVGGRAEARSRPGHGTEVWLWVP